MPTYYIGRQVAWLWTIKYITYDGSNMQGNDNYYYTNPDSVRFTENDKHPKNENDKKK